ncbi:hypothetical protein JCM19000A_14450 [Silvimonas sp. JCM 19000]
MPPFIAIKPLLFLLSLLYAGVFLLRFKLYLQTLNDDIPGLTRHDRSIKKMIADQPSFLIGKLVYWPLMGCMLFLFLPIYFPYAGFCALFFMLVLLFG